jgi:hypothetical protein
LGNIDRSNCMCVYTFLRFSSSVHALLVKAPGNRSVARVYTGVCSSSWHRIIC